jgi:predicted nucleotidyltransferase
MTAAEKILHTHEHEIRELCARLGVRRLEVFGSAVTDRFDPACSDFDFLYEFNDPQGVGLADRFFELKEGLETLLGRAVDLVYAPGIENPYFLRKVNAQRRVLYAA